MKRRDVQMLFPPFPYFGGKRRITHHVWGRFGPVKRYLEPFAGGLAVLLSNPFKLPLCEIVNDRDCEVVNVWRSLKYDIQTVIEYCTPPASELEVYAINLYLNENPLKPSDFEDLEYYNAEQAGLWLYRQGIFPAATEHKRRQRNTSLKMNAPAPFVKYTYDYFEILKARLRNVRIYCRNWDFFVKSDSYFDLRAADTNRIGLFFDPPYLGDEKLYPCVERKETKTGVASDVEKWILENEHPLIRVCLAGHVGDYPTLEAREDWEKVVWERKKNKKHELLLFSPNCDKVNYI